MEYQRLQADTLFGISTNNKSEMGELLNVSLPDIEKMYVSRVSAAATLPVVALGALGLLITVYTLTAEPYW